MLTPQEVSNHAFAKAVMGGYNMAMVDEFLDELTDDYTSLYKENAALKAKMKVLVDKVEEYRSTEDAMRAALLTAQKMADSMVAEAEEKKKSLLENAESEANRKIGALRDEVAQEERRLTAAKAETADFLARVRELYEREMKLLEELHFTLVKLAHAGEEVRGLGLGGGQAALLLRDLVAQRADLAVGLAFGVFEQGLFLLLRLGDHAVCHLLRGQQRGAHGVLGRAVFLDLVHEHLHLRLERGVFLVKRGIVVGQLVKELIDHGHVVAAHDGLGECVVGNLLRCQHRAALRLL